MQKKTVLIAPLNWGLGHATRCIPIIKAFEAAGAEVILASDGVALQLLQREFPHLEVFKLPSYNIRYPFPSMILSIAVQMPKILRGVILEYFWLKKYMKTRNIDVVLSDNRFGFFSKKTYSVFMTHQIQILMPIKILQTLVNHFNHFFISRFRACWIPDFEDNDKNMAGDLAHDIFIKNMYKSLKITYLGVLTRMKRFEIPSKYRAIIVLSGPEPQRTILEKIIINQLENIINNENILYEKRSLEKNRPPQYSKPFCLVRGTQEMGNSINELNKLEIYNLLITNELNQKMMQSDVVICRSGYSSIMDLVALQKPAILIPTPGQTEQIYLAEQLAQQNCIVHQSQDRLNLVEAFENVKKTKGFTDFSTHFDAYKSRLAQIISDTLKNS